MLKQKIVPFQSIPSDTDFTTWSLPQGASARLGQGYVNTIALSPDGAYLCVACEVGLWWYDVSERSPIALWNIGWQNCFAITFSHDSEWLATGDADGVVKIWSVASGKCIAQMKRPLNPEWGHDTTVRNCINTIAFSPDRQRLAVSDGSENACVNIWTLGENGMALETHELKEVEPVYVASSPLTFSLDNRLLACASYDRTLEYISVWEVETGTRVARLEHQGLLCSLSFSPCGQFLAAGFADGIVQVWSIGKWQPHKVYPTHGTFAMYVCYSPEGTLHAAGISDHNECSIAIWDVEQAKTLYKSEVNGCLFPLFINATHLAFACEQEFKGYSVDTGHSYTLQHSDIRIPESISFSLDSKILAARVPHSGIFLGDVESEKDRPLRVFREPMLESQVSADKIYLSLDVSRDGAHFVTAADERVIKLSTLENDTPLGDFTALAEPRSAAFSPITKRLACQDENAQIYIWDTQSGHLRDTYQAESLEARRMVFSPNGKYLISGTALLYDAVRGEKIDTFDLDEMSIHLFSHDSTQLFCDTREAIEVWDIRQYEKVFSIPKPETWACSDVVVLALSACGRYLAGCCDQNPEVLHLWTIDGSESLAVFKGHSPIVSLAFSPDNTLLASGSFDGTILLWDMKPYLRDT